MTRAIAARHLRSVLFIPRGRTFVWYLRYIAEQRDGRALHQLRMFAARTRRASSPAAAPSPSAEAVEDDNDAVRVLSRLQVAAAGWRRAIGRRPHFPVVVHVRCARRTLRLRLQDNVTWHQLFDTVKREMHVPSGSHLYFVAANRTVFIHDTSHLRSWLSQPHSSRSSPRTLFVLRSHVLRAREQALCAHQHANEFVRICEVAPCTIAAVHALNNALSHSRHKQAVKHFAYHFFPYAAALMSTFLGTTGPMEPSAITTLCSDIKSQLRPIASAHIADLVAVAMRAALNDQTLVDALRKINWHAPCYSGSSNDVHVGVKCSCCSLMPIVGSRFRAARPTLNGYDLCAPCKVKLDLTPQGRTLVDLLRLHEIKSPFEVHTGVACFSCSAEPIIGSRFVSLEENSLDMCATCYRRHFEGVANVLELKYKLAGDASLLLFNPTMDFEARFATDSSPNSPTFIYEVICASCRTDLSQSSRYSATDYPNYNLCHFCYREIGMSHESHHFVEVLPVADPS